MAMVVITTLVLTPALEASSLAIALGRLQMIRRDTTVLAAVLVPDSIPSLQ